ncbi:hypothetical protein LSAT2_011127, partial [Lamellibrachia satsuma]
MYPRSKRRVFRKRRRPFVRRRKFRRTFFKQRRKRTVTRRRRRRNYAVKSIVCPVEIIQVPETPTEPEHLSSNTKWSVSDIPLTMRTMWGYNYEEVKFLKVTFKYWVIDAYEKIELMWDDTHQYMRGTGRTAELRYSYDPDNRGRTMNTENIQLRRNSKHIVGSRLGRPWYFRLTFTRGR